MNWKEMLEKCEELGIDAEKVYTASIVDSSIGRDDKHFEEICEMTYKQFNEEEKEKNMKGIVC